MDGWMQPALAQPMLPAFADGVHQQQRGFEPAQLAKGTKPKPLVWFEEPPLRLLAARHNQGAGVGSQGRKF